MPKILIVAGEASGDLHGANLAKAVLALRPEVEILGMGGAKMRAAGVTVLHGIDRVDVVGQIGFNQIGAVFNAFRTIRRVLRSTALDAVIFIDYPGFNLRMARIAAAAGHRVIYYIAPQIWAWAPGRIRLIARVVHHMIVIFPFEERIYREAQVPCTFVGHPLLDEVPPSCDRSALRTRFELATDQVVVGLMPGSREREVRALLPLLVRTVEHLTGRFPNIRCVLAKTSSVPDGVVDALCRQTQGRIAIVHDQPNDVIAVSDVVLVASGTATLQAAVVGTPMIILYKAPWFSYLVARCLIQVPWIGLVNIVAGKALVPELLQHEATVERLAREVTRLLTDQQAYGNIVAGLQAVRASLGDPGASRRAAEVVLQEMA